MRWEMGRSEYTSVICERESQDGGSDRDSKTQEEEVEFHFHCVVATGKKDVSFQECVCVCVFFRIFSRSDAVEPSNY